MKKDLTFDDIARFEKAIAKKYGPEAIQNPRKHWNEEKKKNTKNNFVHCPRKSNQMRKKTIK